VSQTAVDLSSQTADDIRQVRVARAWIDVGDQRCHVLLREDRALAVGGD
jgi:hypothetical protein